LGMLKNGSFAAVKVITAPPAGPENAQTIENFHREVALMRALKHPNIVRYLASCSGITPKEAGTSELLIFLEYMPQGSLRRVINKFGTLNRDVVRRYTAQLIDGLVYLHSHGVIHRDIKPDNVLLDQDGRCKLSDFGCSKQLSIICGSCESTVGTPYYMAPECITGEGYRDKADVWSLGCTIVEMISGKHPWPEFDLCWAAMYHITNTTGPPSGIPSDIHPLLQTFLDNCFQRDVSLRPTALELATHPFFDDLDD
jgi:serine/threonine protein kinase